MKKMAIKLRHFIYENYYERIGLPRKQLLFNEASEKNIY